MIHALDSFLHRALSLCIGDYKIVERFRPIDRLGRPSRHVFKGTVVVCGSTRCIVVKVRNPERDGSTLPSNLSCETASLRHCERVGIPTPKVLGVGPNYEWLVLTHVPGTSIARSELGRDGSTIIRKLGKTLAQIHSCECKPRDEIRGVFRSEDSRHRLAILDGNLQSLPCSKVTIKIAQVLDRARNTIPAREELVFTHRDFSGENVLLTEQNDVCVLDWEAARFSPPEADLAFACGWTSGLCRDDDDAAFLLASYQRYADMSIKTFGFYRALSFVEQAINAVSNREEISADLILSATEYSAAL
jgi:aminoglycoside phosphotransferase (APT) family kinase protein